MSNMSYCYVPRPAAHAASSLGFSRKQKISEAGGAGEMCVQIGYS